MMISRTSMTSTSGVTLMSDFMPPFAPPTSIDIASSPVFDASERRRAWRRLAYRYTATTRRLLRRLLDEVVDHLRRRVVHLDVEVLEAARQVVVEPHRRDGDEQAERGFDERFGNTGRDGADTARAGGRDADERVDDADDRAEQSDERRGRADGRQAGDALLQVVRGERGRALNRAADGVEQVFTRQVGAASPAGTGYSCSPASTTLARWL